MWQIIDKEMSLKECNVYCYSPEEDPYDGEEGGIWSSNYFFFNKARKRVCYIYLRGLSIISHSPIQKSPISVKRSADGQWSREVSGASKRARYWLGDRAAGDVTSGWGGDDDDLDAEEAGEKEEEGLVERLWKDREGSSLSLPDADGSPYLLSADEAPSPCSGRGRSKSTMRAISEDIAESMEI